MLVWADGDVVEFAGVDFLFGDFCEVGSVFVDFHEVDSLDLVLLCCFDSQKALILEEVRFEGENAEGVVCSFGWV